MAGRQVSFFLQDYRKRQRARAAALRECGEDSLREGLGLGLPRRVVETSRGKGLCERLVRMATASELADDMLESQELDPEAPFFGEE
jgi:hypothetical protein